MILITGGARSGKSQLAERLAQQHGGKMLYIATSLVTDEEMVERISLHQQQRPTEWLTYEGYAHLGAVVTDHQTQADGIILECITTMITNILFEQAGSLPEEQMDFEAIETEIQSQIDELLSACDASKIPIWIVTNELGLGLVPEYLLARRFRDIAGRVNQRLAARADTVYLVISGIDIKIKG